MEFANADRKSADLRIFILSIPWMSDNVFTPVQYHEFHMTIHSFSFIQCVSLIIRWLVRREYEC